MNLTFFSYYIPFIIKTVSVLHNFCLIKLSLLFKVMSAKLSLKLMEIYSSKQYERTLVRYRRFKRIFFFRFEPFSGSDLTELITIHEINRVFRPRLKRLWKQFLIHLLIGNISPQVIFCCELVNLSLKFSK